MGIVEVDGYLTFSEARAAGVRWRPRHRIETDEDRINACSVLLSDATRNVQGWGWMCRVCARVPLKYAERWSWLGCPICRGVDARAARRLGGKRFIPLGMHSIMNGASIPLSMPDGPELTAMFERVVAMSASWDLLGRWGEAEFARLVADARGRAGEPVESVPVPQWREWFPPSREASADAYSRMLAEQFAWLVDADPVVGEARWLAGGRASSAAYKKARANASSRTEESQ